MNCVWCGAPLAEEARFCGHCGGAITAARCPRCATTNQPGSAFCVSCGAALIPDQRALFQAPQRSAPPSTPSGGAFGPAAGHYPPVTLPGRPAGFWIRFLAYIIDFFALSALLSPLAVFIVWLSFLQAFEPAGDISSGLLLAYGLLYPLMMLISLAYIVGFWAWRGQTPGKMALGLRIVRVNGDKLSVGRSLLRLLGYWVSSLIFDIGFILIGFDQHKQGLHDKIADTLVIHSR